MNIGKDSKTGFIILLLLSWALLFTFDSCRTTLIAGEQRYKIAVCDWMILKRQKPGAVKLAHDIGADGIELDMGGLGNRPTFDNKLTDPLFRNQYDSLLRVYKVEVSSIAMSGFYAQNFAEREGVDRMIQDCIKTMKLMNVKVAFLPLGVEGDLVKHPERRPAIVDRLRMAGRMAEKAGVVIGVETALDATGEVQLLKEIGSPAIRIYFNFANALEAGRDISTELRIIGNAGICQIHCTDKDGVLLRNNKRIDLPEVKKTLDKMGWRGWLVVERSRDAAFPTDVKKNFTDNVAFLKSVFQ